MPPVVSAALRINKPWRLRHPRGFRRPSRRGPFRRVRRGTTRLVVRHRFARRMVSSYRRRRSKRKLLNRAFVFGRALQLRSTDSAAFELETILDAALILAYWDRTMRLACEIACSKSVQRSSTSSRPTDSRISPSTMPCFFRSSAS